MEELIRIMSEIRPDLDFTKEDKVNDFFNIELNVNDLLAENFNSAAALYDLIQKMSGK